MLSAEGPNRKLTHRQATPFLILTCGVGFVPQGFSLLGLVTVYAASFPTYPLTAVGPTKIVSNRQRPMVLRSSILRKGRPYLHGQNGSEIDWLRFVNRWDRYDNCIIPLDSTEDILFRLHLWPSDATAKAVRHNFRHTALAKSISTQSSLLNESIGYAGYLFWPPGIRINVIRSG